MEFVKFNNNPKNLKTGDCVVRAISRALNLKWDEVYTGLCELGLKWKRMPNNKEIYKKYLNQKGIYMENMPKKLDNKRYTVKEFIDVLAKDNTNYIISVANHLTVVCNKTLYDTWDCSRKSVGNYWIVRNRY